MGRSGHARRGARHCGGCGHGVRFVRRRRAGSVRCAARAAERPARPRARALRAAGRAAGAARRSHHCRARHRGTAGGRGDHSRHPPNSHRRRDGLQRRTTRRALRRPNRQEGDAAGGLRPRPAHHRQIRRRRLRALARHRAGAGTRSQRRRGQDPGGGRLHRKRAMAAATLGLSRFLLLLRIEDQRRTAGQYPHHRALPPARRRPARAQVQEQCQAASQQGGRGDPRRRGDGKTDRLLLPGRQPRHAGARSARIFEQHDLQQSLRRTRGVDADGRRRVQNAGTAILRSELPAGVEPRRPDLLRQRELRVRPPRNGRAAVPELSHAKLLCRNRAELPRHSRARAQSRGQRIVVLEQRPRHILGSSGRPAEHPRPHAWHAGAGGRGFR